MVFIGFTAFSRALGFVALCKGFFKGFYEAACVRILEGF